MHVCTRFCRQRSRDSYHDYLSQYKGIKTKPTHSITLSHKIGPLGLIPSVVRTQIARGWFGFGRTMFALFYALLSSWALRRLVLSILLHSMPPSMTLGSGSET
jgi:hypothetical protein